MKHISRIKEVSELFHLPASALRYWDDEGLIRFERSKDNHYRCPTSQTMLDICDVIFYRSLSLSIKEIKSIPGMCVEDVDHTLETNARRLEDQIRQMQMTISSGYPSSDSYSGILKFMPYQPASRVSGIKIVVTTVKNCIVLFIFRSRCA